MNNKSGSFALEFAILAPIFLAACFYVVEFSIFTYKKSHLKHVLYSASRVMQTGQIQNNADPKKELQSQICAVAKDWFDCEKVYFDVRKGPAKLSDVNVPDAKFTNEGVPTNFTYQTTGPSDITVMRLAANYKFISPYMQKWFQPDGKPVIVVGQAIFKNEPF